MLKFLLVVVIIGVYTASKADASTICKSVNCDSLSYKYNTCKIIGSKYIIKVTVANKKSESECIYGKSYGENASDIWVDKGCRATFEVCYLPVDAADICKPLYCDSLSYKHKTCQVIGSKHVTKVTVTNKKSKSECLYGKSFGRNASDIWVDDGCRATFEVCYIPVESDLKCKSVNCDSFSYKYNTCKITGSEYVAKVTVSNKRSKSECIYGKSFGRIDSDIWVDDGCRATFDVCYLPVDSADICKSINCDSLSYKYKRCQVIGSKYVTKITVTNKKSESACTYGKSFGRNAGDIWVDDGCRATFEVCYAPGFSRDIKCSSWNFKRATCSLGKFKTIEAITLLSQESKSPCKRGHSFGRDGNSIYVDHGCRATFRVFYDL